MRWRWLSTWGGLAVLAGASCAKGTGGLLGLGGGGPGAGGSTATGSTGSTAQVGSSASGSGGAGVTSTTTGSNPPTTSTTSTTSSSTSGGCPDTPCKLTTPQCGCPAGEQCTISGFAPACQPPGNTPQGQGCLGGNTCVPGTLCVGGGAIGICDLFCATDADCSVTGGICALGLSDGAGGSIPDATLCSATCDPTSSVGCDVAGTGCQLGREQTGQMRWLTYCASTGSLTKDQVCDPTLSECAATFGCFFNGVNDTCLEYCYVGGGSCPSGQGCAALQDQSMLPIYLGGNQVGVCQ